jgi:hypothetical protein
MDNFLDNGAVLPSGLIGSNDHAAIAGFNKTYKNTSLRMGVILRSHPVSDKKNLSKLSIEYDVSVFEQNEDRGSTTITYKNCISAEGMGGIADFFEKSLRFKKNSSSNLSNTKGQDGAIVLILCLDGMTEKAIVIGAMTHPDRQSTLIDNEPHLEGEYNGVRIKIAKDGSTSLVFKGATDNKGKALDPSQASTTVKIEKDGSFQVNHDSITFRMARDGTATLNAKKDINIITNANVNVTATKDATVKCVNATVQASANINLKAGSKIDEKAPKISLNGESSGITTENSHQGVIDFITGVPVMPSQTVKSDV